MAPHLHEELSHPRPVSSGDVCRPRSHDLRAACAHPCRPGAVADHPGALSSSMQQTHGCPTALLSEGEPPHPPHGAGHLNCPGHSPPHLATQLLPPAPISLPRPPGVRWATSSMSMQGRQETWQSGGGLGGSLGTSPPFLAYASLRGFAFLVTRWARQGDSTAFPLRS